MAFELCGGKPAHLKGHICSCPLAIENGQQMNNTNCDCLWGLGQSKFRNIKFAAPHTGRQRDSVYLFQTEFTTWQTMFGKFRFLLSVKAQKQAWSLSLPTISFSKQNIIPEEALIFELAHEGDFKGILKLFRKGLASPNDRTVDGRTPLMVCCETMDVFNDMM
jgi:hypothetical protein